MTTTIRVGKARVFNCTFTAGGVPDTTTAATIGASNPTLIKTAMNPANNRQFAVQALAPGNTNANVNCGPVTLHANITVPSPPPPDAGSIDEAGATDEVDPSTIPWL